ncbi:MAG: TetR/AcrR family transcriptional regulator [Aliidongia sp.]
MRHGAETHEKIRREAMRLVVAHGVDAVSVRQIAEAAGVRPSTLYVHWPSRDALIADLFASGYAEYGRRIAEIALPEAPFRQRFAAIVRLICRFEAEDETLFTFLLLSQHHHLGQIPAGAETPIDIIQRAVSEAMRDGEIPAGDPALVTAALAGIVLQAATFHAYRRIAKGLTEMADELVALCLKILAP